MFAWVADALSEYQDQVAEEAALRARRRLGLIVHHVLSEAALTVTVDGAHWQPIAAWSQARPGDRAYVVETGAAGTSTIRFGDGRTGARPPEGGSEVAATYRPEGGAVGITATVRWPSEPGAVTVRLAPDRLALEPAHPRPRGVLACLLECLRRRS
jgi:hypothetical protein